MTLFSVKTKKHKRDKRNTIYSNNFLLQRLLSNFFVICKLTPALTDFMRHFKKTYKSKSYHLDNCCYWKIRHHTFFRCKIVFIHFALFLIFTLWDQTLSRYSDNESNDKHFLIFWKISDGCFYIRISSISDVKLKFVFSRTAMTISSAKYIRAFLRWIIIGFFILCCISSYFSLTYEAVRIND